MTTHAVAVLMEDRRRDEQRDRMVRQREAREAALVAGTLPTSVRPARVAARGGEHAGMSPQMQSVLDYMMDGREHTIPEGAQACEMKETSFSARLRDLRKEKFGAHTVLRRVEEGTSYFRIEAKA